MRKNSRESKKVAETSVEPMEVKEEEFIQELEPQLNSNVVDLPSNVEGDDDYDFPELVPFDSASQPLEAQLPLMSMNSVFSNLAPDELLQNTGLSRQTSTAKPSTLYAEDNSVSNRDKEDS